MGRGRTNVEAFSLFSFQDIITSVTGVIILVTLMLAVELVQRKPVAMDAADPSAHSELLDKLRSTEELIEATRKILQEGKAFLGQVAELPTSRILQEEEVLEQTIDELSKEILKFETAITDSRFDPDDVLSSDDVAHLREVAIATQAKIDRLTSELTALKNSNRIVYNANPLSQKAAWLVDLSPEVIRIGEPGKPSVVIEFKSDVHETAVTRFVGWANRRDRRAEYFVILLRPHSIKIYEAVHQQLVAAGFSTGVDLIEAHAIVMEPVTEEF